jgi:hypothetical protein
MWRPPTGSGIPQRAGDRRGFWELIADGVARSTDLMPFDPHRFPSPTCRCCVRATPQP